MVGTRKRKRGTVRVMPLVGMLLGGFLSFGPLRPAAAVGVHVVVPGRVDSIHDVNRGVLYTSFTQKDAFGVILNSGVHRYNLATQTALPPIPIYGDLKGLDLSLDGNTLLVCDNRTTAGLVWVHQVDLNTLAVTQVSFPAAFMEGGTFAVAFGNDGSALVTSTFLGSGDVPLRRYDPASGGVEVLQFVGQNSMVSASADGGTIGFVQGNLSSGPFGTYRVLDGLIQHGLGTGWFNYEVGVSRDGSQFSVPTFNGTYVYDAFFNSLALVGVNGGQQPIGVAYHPLQDRVYYAWATQTQIQVRRTTDFGLITTHDFQNTFDHPGNMAFVEGRLRVSRDGSLLIGTVDNGVRWFQIFAPSLVANAQTVRTGEDVPVGVTLSGLGNGGALDFTVTSGPASGSLSGTAPNLVYTPGPNFSGTDSFQFTVSAGAQVSQPATVWIVVTPLNDNPVAVPDTAQTARRTPIVLHPLANDSDPDGDTISLFSAGTTGSGTLTIDGNTITYTPRNSFRGTEVILYTITDGNGGFASSTITVEVVQVKGGPNK